MKHEIHRSEQNTERPFTLVINSSASRKASWSADQDAILNDQAFQDAFELISTWDGYEATPLHDLNSLSSEAGVSSIAYKDESQRFGLGSFKALGGAYAVARLLHRRSRELGEQDISVADIINRRHDDVVKNITVCCATDGNHGRSVAWGAQTFGCKCVIFIHATVSESRKQAIEHYGAEVHRCDGNYDDSVREAQVTAAKNNWFVVSDTSYPGYMDVPKDVMQGYELMAYEAFEQLPEAPTHIFLQTGVGGMAAAVAAHAKRRWGDNRPLIVLADPDESACWVDSYRANEPTSVSGDLDTLMAGLACGEVSALAWQILVEHGDAAMSVPDSAAVEMMRRLAKPEAEEEPLVAGESAVAGIAALFAAMEDKEAADVLSLNSDSRILVFGTEGDTDAELYESLVGADADAVRRRAL